MGEGKSIDDLLKPTMRGTIIIEEDGRKCFIYGKTRLHVTEHFPDKGKTFSEILDEIILQRASEFFRRCEEEGTD